MLVVVIILYVCICIKTGRALEKLNLDIPLGSASEGQLGERCGKEDFNFVP